MHKVTYETLLYGYELEKEAFAKHLLSLGRKMSQGVAKPFAATPIKPMTQNQINAIRSEYAKPMPALQGDLGNAYKQFKAANPTWRGDIPRERLNQYIPRKGGYQSVPNAPRPVAAVPSKGVGQGSHYAATPVQRSSYAATPSY